MSYKSIIITGIAAFYSAANSPAAVIYTQLPEPRLLGPEIGSFGTVHPFDIDGDREVDFNFGTTRSGTTLFPEVGNFIAYSPSSPPDVGGDVGPLPLGSIIGEDISMIDASLLWSERSGTVIICMDIGCGGLFVGRDAYIGLRFERPEGTHFGYIHFVTESDSPYGYLHDWAWETQPGTPIIAGSIPEPSTWILILGGFISVIGHRRRNNQGIKPLFPTLRSDPMALSRAFSGKQIPVGKQIPCSQLVKTYCRGILHNEMPSSTALRPAGKMRDRS